MKRVGAFLRDKFSLTLAVLLCGGLLGQPTLAGAEGFFTARRSLGLVFLGGSAVMAKQGVDFKDEADKFYRRYKKATDPTEIDLLYQRTNNRDIKSQVSWALAAGFAVSGLRLVLFSAPEKGYERTGRSENRVETSGYGVELGSRIDRGQVGFRLKKSFF